MIDDQGRRQKLKAWFINEKIPKEERDRMLLVADGSHIVWIPGYRMSRTYKVTEKTKNIVEIKITEEEKDGRNDQRDDFGREVDERIRELGRQISEDYAGKQIHLICVLKGGVFFMCELAKRITVPVSMDFMCVGSYGDGTASSGVVRIAKDLDESIENKEVLIVEDIIDSGNTLYYLIDVLKKRNPASMRCVRFWISRTAE